MAVLNLRGQVGEVRAVSGDLFGRPQDRAGVDDLGRVDASHRAAKDVAWHVAAGLLAGQADLFEPAPDGRDVFDADPVELDVLPVGDVGQVLAELLGDAADGARLVGGQLTARDANPHHEVRVLDLGVLEGTGLAAADAGLALRVQAPPAEPATQVARVDGVEAQVGVAVQDAIADVQPVVVLLESLGGVKRLVET